MRPEVSGVGLLNHDPRSPYKAPRGFSERWDDVGYTFPTEDEVQLMMFITIPSSSRYGFIVHDSCYSLLEEFFKPREVPVSRLLDLCWSCPFLQLNVLDWGHDYGGYIVMTDHHPWEDQGIALRQPLRYEDEHMYEDPWNSSEVEEILQQGQLDLPKGLGLDSLSSIETDGPVLSNCLTRLPIEILEHIVTCLHVEDAIALSQTSKGLIRSIPSGLGQSFWASRFQPPFELGFVFEANYAKERLDWKSLYFKFMKVVPSSTELRNRKRIWNIIQSPLSELACLRWGGDSTLRPLSADKAQLRWEEARGRLKPMTCDKVHDEQGPVSCLGFRDGCKEFYTQRTAVPGLISQVVITTVSTGNAPFITGLRFIPLEGPDICLGYTEGGKKSYLDTFDKSMKANSIRGFVVSAGSKGIQGLRVIIHARKFSKWVGLSDRRLKPHRLVVPGSIVGLEAGFDGFKMVRLAIAENYSASHENRTRLQKKLKERKDTRKRPRVPENPLKIKSSLIK
ncbi:hypothetical protein FQN49_003658 [Arthroderma sp. PD_2]|nr:hypothetical protein FQN49_003658 [Arthroderma sp. PD_2]